ncbi:MAG: stage II sporulation protein M [Bacillus sp. (in: firmicutes)]
MKKKPSLQAVAYQHIREHSSLYIFIVVLFLMGVICGSVIVNSLSITQKEDLFYYLNRFFGEAGNKSLITPMDMFLGSLKHNLQFIGIIWILGISIIGIPVILILLFLKGVMVGFTVGFLVNSMGWKGFLIAIGSILPQNLIMVPLTIFITVVALTFCIQIIQRVFLKNVRQSMKPMMLQYLLAFVICAVFIGGAGLIEAYFSPVMLAKLVHL